MKKLILPFALGFGLLGFAQNKLRFDYDTSGNQKKREICFYCNGKNSQIDKNLEKLKGDDLTEFFPEDNLSYYPNPVNEELFLNWKIEDGNLVSKIDLFSLNGQLLRSNTITENINSFTLAFSKYPSGVYFVTLFYAKGEQKTIKIVKK